MPITYVRKDNPNEVLGTFSDEELGMKMSDTSGGYAGQTEKERIESLGWVAKNTENKTVPPPEKPSGTTGTEGTTGEGTTGEKTGGDSYNDAINAQKGLVDFYQSQYDRLQTEFDNYTKDIAEIDSENNPMIQDIKATFERRKAEMAKLNQSMQGQLGLTQGRTGMARYAPETAQGFISAEITNGMNRLSELESQKLAAIQEAKRALKSDAEDKWKTFNEMMNNATKAYENKVTAVKDLHAMVKAEEDAVLDRAKSELELQKLQQEVMASNLDSYSTAFVDFDENGNVIMADAADLQSFSKQSGIPYEQIVGAVRTKAYELSKLSQEDRLKELQISKLQRDIIGETAAEWQDAVNNGWTSARTPLEYLAEKKIAEKGGTEPIGETGLSRDALIMRLGKQVYGTRISDAEREFLSGMVDKGIRQGITEMDLIDTVLGFQITGDKKLANNLKQVLLQAPTEEGLAGFDMLGLSRLINEGKNAEAVRKVEQMVMKQAKSADPDGFISESTVKSQVNKANDLKSFVDNLEKNPIGVVEGSMTKWIKRNFRGEEEQQILSKITSLVAEMRNNLSGTNVTETEQRFLAPLVPDINDTPDNFMKKLEELKKKGIIELNGFRSTFGLSSLDEKSLIDMNSRVNSYLNKQYSSLKELPDDKFKEAIELQKIYPDWSEEELLEAISFNNEQQSSLKGSKTENNINKIANAIGQFESGGNYSAVGPEVISGMYKGDKAYGKYQIMGKNIPSWSKEALGYSITKEQFLNNPELQDKIAQYKMGKYYEQYKDVGDVASMWFSGRPVAKAGNAKDVLGTSVPQYVKNVISIYNKLA